jgi:hypothetical protein
MFFLIFAGSCAIAQNDTTSVKVTRIVLTDNTVYYGYILTENDSLIILRTASGVDIRIPKLQIKRRRIQNGFTRNGEIWYDDPNISRLFFAPTARPLGQGNAYFSDVQIFFPFAAFGIGDVLTLGGGMSLFPGSTSQILYAAPKVTFVNTPNAAVAAGVLYLFVPDDFNAGILYGVSSLGNPHKTSLTFGMGYGFAGDDVAENPILLLGFESRMSRSTKLISENWIITGGDVSFLSFGIRAFGENIAADFAFVRPIGDTGLNGFPFIPWLGFTYNFN